MFTGNLMMVCRCSCRFWPLRVLQQVSHYHLHKILGWKSEPASLSWSVRWNCFRFHYFCIRMRWCICGSDSIRSRCIHGVFFSSSWITYGQHTVFCKIFEAVTKYRSFRCVFAERIFLFKPSCSCSLFTNLWNHHRKNCTFYRNKCKTLLAREISSCFLAIRVQRFLNEACIFLQSIIIRSSLCRPQLYRPINFEEGGLF